MTLNSCLAAEPSEGEYHKGLGTRDELEQWVRNWQITGPILEEIRLRELAQLNLADFIESMNGPLKASLRIDPPRPCSGLVELQEWFGKLPRDFRVIRE
jgi:hypothetical protein